MRYHLVATLGLFSAVGTGTARAQDPDQAPRDREERTWHRHRDRAAWGWRMARPEAFRRPMIEPQTFRWRMAEPQAFRWRMAQPQMFRWRMVRPQGFRWRGDLGSMFPRRPYPAWRGEVELPRFRTFGPGRARLGRMSGRYLTI